MSPRDGHRDVADDDIVVLDSDFKLWASDLYTLFYYHRKRDGFTLVVIHTSVVANARRSGNPDKVVHHDTYMAVVVERSCVRTVSDGTARSDRVI